MSGRLASCALLLLVAGTARADVATPPAGASPLALVRMEGPYPSPEAYCRSQDEEARRWEPRTRCHLMPARVVRGIATRWAWIADPFDRYQDWYVLLQARDGWYAHLMPGSGGRGTEQVPGGVEVRDAERGAPLVLFSLAYREIGRPPSDEDDLHVRRVYACTIAGARPACLSREIPASEWRNATPEEPVTVRVAMSLGRATWLPDGRLALDVVADQLRIDGDRRLARSWREDLAPLVGHHLLAPP